MQTSFSSAKISPSFDKLRTNEDKDVRAPGKDSQESANLDRAQYIMMAVFALLMENKPEQ
jgi:hypothetical protein